MPHAITTGATRSRVSRGDPPGNVSTAVPSSPAIHESPDMTSSPHSADTHWFVLRSQTGGELKAFASITELARRREREGGNEIAAYVPVETRWKHLTPKDQPKQRKLTPLFRSYVFVLCTPGDLWLIEDCDGISGFYRNLANNAPMTVPAQEIEQLQAREAKGSFDYTRDRKGKDTGAGARFNPCVGMRVTLTQHDTTAVITEVQHPGRVMVMPDTGLRFPTSVHIRDMELLAAEPATAELEAA